MRGGRASRNRHTYGAGLVQLVDPPSQHPQALTGVLGFRPFVSNKLVAKISISNGRTQYSMFRLLDFLMPARNMSSELWLNTSHLHMLTWRPSGGSNSWSKAKTFITEDLGPARAPSSMYQAWKLRPAQSSLVEITDTRMFKTKENNNGSRGHPAERPALM